MTTSLPFPYALPSETEIHEEQMHQRVELLQQLLAQARRHRDEARAEIDDIREAALRALADNTTSGKSTASALVEAIFGDESPTCRNQRCGNFASEWGMRCCECAEENK